MFHSVYICRVYLSTLFHECDTFVASGNRLGPKEAPTLFEMLASLPSLQSLDLRGTDNDHGSSDVVLSFRHLLVVSVTDNPLAIAHSGGGTSKKNVQLLAASLRGMSQLTALDLEGAILGPLCT